MAFENGCCRAEELLGREQGEIRAFFQDKGDEMAKTVGREILPKAADWTAKSCSFALRTGAFWGIGMIAAFWLCKDYARFSEWMKKSEIWENIDRILRMTGGYCRAQLKILVIISGSYSCGALDWKSQKWSVDWTIGRDFGCIADDRNRHCADSDCNLAAFE